MKENIKCVPLRIPEDLHTFFKTQVAKDQTNMNSKLIELIKIYLEHNS